MVLEKNMVLEELINGILAVNITYKREEIPIDENLIELGMLDSVDLLEFISFIEDKFKIEVKDDEMTLENFGTLIAINKYVLRKVG
jgi:acyl carrier protein